jgi:Tol biopolymer transport system component
MTLYEHVTDAAINARQGINSLRSKEWTMTRRALMSITAMSVISVAGQAQVQERPEVLLQAAIHSELADGCAEAIEKYRPLVKAKSDAVASQALTRLAACYDRLGKMSDARTAYGQVVRDYRDRKDAVAEASAWLKAHSIARQRGMQIAQVSIASARWEAPSVSADGRYLAYADWSTGVGNITLRDLSTGETRQLTRHPAGGQVFAERPLISADGKQVVYRLDEGADSSLHVISVEGARDRVLLRDKHDHTVMAWSPDGRLLAAVDSDRRIVLLSAADGSKTQLKSHEWAYPVIGGFSPDGRYLVYSLPKHPSSTESGIFVLAVDGTAHRTLVHSETATDTSPLWSPDGRRVVFMSDRSGANSLWSVPVADGRADGQPELLRGDMGAIRVAGFARDGSLYYDTDNARRDAYIARLDGRTPSAPQLVSERFVGSNAMPELSPDGTRVAFIRHGTASTLIVRSLADGRERVLGDITDPYLARAVQWFPDSRAVLVHDRLSPGSTFRRIDVDTGAERVLFQGSYAIIVSALSRDGRTLFYSLRESDAGIIRLIKRVLETGAESDVLTVKSGGVAFFGLSLSPDGTQFAWSRNEGDGRVIEVMPVEGGTVRRVFAGTVSNPSPQGTLAWTADGHLLFEGQCGSGEVIRLCSIPVAGGSPVPISFAPANIKFDRTPTRMISADGRRLAFTATTTKRELWVIRDFLPGISR